MTRDDRGEQLAENNPWCTRERLPTSRLDAHDRSSL